MSKRVITLVWIVRGVYLYCHVYDGDLKVGRFSDRNILVTYHRKINTNTKDFAESKKHISKLKSSMKSQVKKRFPGRKINDKISSSVYRFL